MSYNREIHCTIEIKETSTKDSLLVKKSDFEKIEKMFVRMNEDSMKLEKNIRSERSKAKKLNDSITELCEAVDAREGRIAKIKSECENFLENFCDLNSMLQDCANFVEDMRVECKNREAAVDIKKHVDHRFRKFSQMLITNFMKFEDENKALRKRMDARELVVDTLKLDELNEIVKDHRFKKSIQTNLRVHKRSEAYSQISFNSPTHLSTVAGSFNHQSPHHASQASSGLQWI
jgi:chromosome segregation ATPase